LNIIYKKNVEFNGTSDFWDRHQRHIRLMQERQAEYERLKRFKEEEVEIYDFKPRINNEINLNRTVDDLYKWKEKVENKKSQMRKEKDLGVTKSVDKIRGKQVYLEERWIELAKKKSIKPISPIKSDKQNVSERLYDYGKVYERKRKEREAKLYSGLFHPQTNKYVRRPIDLSPEIKPRLLISENKSLRTSPIPKAISNQDINKFLGNKQIHSAKNDQLKFTYDESDKPINSKYHNVSPDRDQNPFKINTFVKLNTYNADDSAKTNSKYKDNTTISFIRNDNNEFGTQTSQTFFNDLGHVESYKDVTQFNKDEPSFRNKIIDDIIEQY